MLRSVCICCFVCFIFLSSCGTKKGKPVPEFSVKAMDGSTINSSEFMGKITVVCIWATWCGPCIKEIPELNALVDEYRADERVQFVAISDEKVETVRRMLKRKPFNYKQITDAKDIKRKLHPAVVQTIPKNMVIDQNGIVTLELLDYQPEIRQQLKTEIERLLSKQ